MLKKTKWVLIITPIFFFACSSEPEQPSVVKVRFDPSVARAKRKQMQDAASISNRNPFQSYFSEALKLQLKLVGVLDVREKRMALLENKDGQTSTFYEGQWLAADRILISKIFEDQILLNVTNKSGTTSKQIVYLGDVI